MMKFLLSPVFIYFALALTGCGGSGESTDARDLGQKVGELAKKAAKGVNDILPDVSGLSKSKDNVSNATQEEFEKFFSIEYKILELPEATSSGEIEGALNQLGKDRWECISVERTNGKIRFVMKRPAKSYLRYMKSFF